MTRDAYLWMSISVVAASMAWSAVDIHEQRAAAPESVKATASSTVSAASAAKSVPVMAAAPEQSTGRDDRPPVAIASPEADSPAPDADLAMARNLTTIIATVLPSADEGDRLDIRTQTGSTAAHAVADEREPAVGTGEGGDAIAIAAAVAGDSVSPEEPKDPTSATGSSIDALRTVALRAIGNPTGVAPRPAGRWARLIGTDVDAELHCLALNIYWEARSEPTLGRFAVAAVTLNRVGHKRFPNTVCGVVSQGESLGPHRCQFSWMCDGKKNEPQNDKAWREAEHIARSMVFLDLPDPTDGALWYHADYVSPGWAKAMAQITQIGRHLFYRAAVRQARASGGLAG